MNYIRQYTGTQTRPAYPRSNRPRERERKKERERKLERKKERLGEKDLNEEKGTGIKSEEMWKERWVGKLLERKIDR